MLQFQMGRWMGHFLEPDMELVQNYMSYTYSTEIWHNSCFYGEQYGTVKKRHWN